MTDGSRPGKRRTAPSQELVSSWPVLLELAAPSAYEDANGHVGVVGHMAVYDRAAWSWMAALGMDPSGSGGSSTIMDLQHHLQYLAEIMVGDELAVHGHVLARDARRLHGYWAILNRSRRGLAGTLEFLSIHVDLRARRSAAFPAEVADVLDAQVKVAPDATALGCCLGFASS